MNRSVDRPPPTGPAATVGGGVSAPSSYSTSCFVTRCNNINNGIDERYEKEK